MYNGVYGVNSKDIKVTKLAKQAAIICCFAIHNPLHVSFEDGNICWRDGSFESEYEWNKEDCSKNGEKMFQYIEDFLNEFTSLSVKDQKECYWIFHDMTWKYLASKISRKAKEKGSPRAYRHYLDDNGDICIATISGEILYKF